MSCGLGRIDGFLAQHKPLTIDGTPTLLTPDDGRHYAFPGFVVAANGDYLAAYRDAPAHDVSTSGTTLANRGVIRLQRSTDNGATWGSGVVIADDGTNDSRDPMLTRLANNDLVLSFFVHQGLPNVTPFISISTDNGATWGTPIEVTNPFEEYAAACAPVVELTNGDLLLPLYGILTTGDTDHSIAVVRSTDGGATWGSSVTIVDGGARADNWTEPNIVRLASGNLVCLIRGPESLIWRSVSTDNGASWSEPIMLFEGYGRPAVTQLASGLVVCMYRRVEAQGARDAVWRASCNEGATWSEEYLFYEPGQQMVYAQMQEVSTGVVGVIHGAEDSNTDASVYYTELAEL